MPGQRFSISLGGLLARAGGKRAGEAAADPLGAVPLFAVLSPELRARVAKKLTSRDVGDDRPLFSSGEESGALHVVRSGRFRVYVRDRFGQERVLHFVGPGEVLRESSFMAETPHVARAEAVEPSRVWRLGREDFNELLANEQPAMRYLASVIAQRQAQANTRLASENAPEDARSERGHVTAVYSPRGGSGATTLAIAMSLSLALRFPDDVVLMDLDTLFGHVLANLWLQGRGTLAQVSPNTLRQLDRRGLDFYLLPHQSSLRVFPSALRPEEGEQVTAEHVRAAVGTLKRHFGHVVLDLPHNFSDVALTGLELADQVYVLATPDPGTLRDVVETHRILTEVLKLSGERVHYLLNHPQPYSGVPVADFAAATGTPWDELSFAGDAPSQAALRGESLVSTHPGNPLSKLATKLADAIARNAGEQQALLGR